MNERTGEMSYGFASNLRGALPNASFIGFTGTVIQRQRRSLIPAWGIAQGNRSQNTPRAEGPIHPTADAPFITPR